MNRTVRFLWPAWSLAAIIAGVFGPWSEGDGVHINGPADEIAGIVAAAAAIGLVGFALTRSRQLAVLLLLAGAICAVIAAGDANDPAGPFGGPGPNVQPGWGLWTALAGSVSLVLASAMLIRHSRRRSAGGASPQELIERFRHHATVLSPGLLAPSRSALLRAQQARMAERAAEAARRVATDAVKHERDFREEFVRVAGRVTPYVAVEMGELVYILPARQNFGVGRFAKLNWKEHRHLDRAVEVLSAQGVESRGTTFVDVGANVGTTIIHALKRHGFAAGVAIEPEPANLRLLRANLAANGLDGAVEVFDAAASNRDGQGELVLRPQSGGKHHLKADKVAHSGAMRVELTTLDGLGERGKLDLESVGLLWLDIQGGELEALQGASGLLSRSTPIVLEFDTRELRGSRLDALHDVLAANYTGVVDLGTSRPNRDVLPLSTLRQIADRHAGTFTDVLVLRA